MDPQDRASPGVRVFFTTIVGKVFAMYTVIRFPEINPYSSGGQLVYLATLVLSCGLLSTAFAFWCTQPDYEDTWTLVTLVGFLWVFELAVRYWWGPDAPDLFDTVSKSKDLIFLVMAPGAMCVTSRLLKS